jgi:hypothetical protein
MKLTGANLTVLLTWYQHSNVAKMKKDKKLAAWVVIVSSGRAPPPYEQWSGVDNAKLLEAQSDIVEMAHTALGHLEELKKKELVLAAITMSNEEFDQLVIQRNQLIVELAVASGDNHINSDALILPPKLIVNSTMTTGNNASTDTFGDRGGGLWGVRMGFSSGNSCYKCIFMVLCRFFLPKKTNRQMRRWGGG